MSSSLQQFEVVLDNSVFLPGQELRGRVLIRITPKPDGKLFNTRGVHIRLQGRAQVGWTERESRYVDGKNESHNVVYSQQEDYFDHKIQVYGYGSEEKSLPPGDHSFPFSFNLPFPLPSSFESEYGSVRYWAKANIDRPWKFDPEAKTLYTINSLFDLNLISGAKVTGHQMDHKHLCCLCCKNGPISAVLDISKVGYVPGEAILLNAEVDNKSSRRMNTTQFKLHQICTFSARGKSKKVETTVAKMDKAPIEPGESDGWRNCPLMVPSLPPTGLVGCSLIDISYVLEFQVEPSGVGMSLKLVQPIIIGTIPLVQSFHYFTNPVAFSYPPPPSAPESSSFPPPPSNYNELLGPSAPPNPYHDLYPNLPPPTYSEVMVMSDNSRMDMRSEEDGEHTRGNWEFVPLYVTYTSNYEHN